MHIITPYNPWAPKKKKTWQEEQWEQQAIAEAEARMIMEASKTNKSNSLPQNAPPIATPTAGPMANAMAGAGGYAPAQAYNVKAVTPTFTRTPASAVAPCNIAFQNLTPNKHLYTFLWVFSDGQTSTNPDPVMLFQTGSTAAYGITASLQVSSSWNIPGNISSPVYTFCTPPTVTAKFTMVSSSKTVPSTFTFTNTSTNTSQIPSTTYKWLQGSGSVTSTLATPPTFIYTKAGAYTASLQATGSYGITSLYTASFILA